MIRSKWLKIVFIVLFVLGMAAFSQDKQSVGDKDKGLREEILAVYQSKGEQGLRHFFENQKDKVANNIIRYWTKMGLTERNEELLKVCQIIADEKKDDKNLAYVFYAMGYYFIYSPDSSKGLDYFDKAVTLCQKINNSTERGRLYLKMGITFLFNGNILEFLEMYNNFLNFYGEIGYLIGNIYLQKGIFFHEIMKDRYKALEMFEKALEIFVNENDIHRQGYVFLREGIVYFELDENSKTIEMFDRALPLLEISEDSMNLGNLYRNKGNFYTKFGNYSKALEMLDKSLQFYERLNDSSMQGGLYAQGIVYMNKGQIYFYKYEYLNALRMNRKALHLFEKIGNAQGLANAYFTLGVTYSNIGSYSKALEMYYKALYFCDKANSYGGKGNVYSGIGVININLGDFKNAMKMFEKASYWYIKENAIIAASQVCLHQSKIYLYNNDISKALDLIKKAMSNSKKTGVNPSEMGDIYKMRGDIYLGIGSLSKALESYESAIKCYKDSEVIKPEGLFFGKAKILSKLGKKKEAMALFEEGFKAVEKVRQKITLPELKISYMESFYDLYEDTFIFMYDNQYYQEGFKTTESMRARCFLDQMAEGLVSIDKGLTSDLKEKRDILANRLSSLNKQISETSRENDEKKLAELKEQYRQVEADFEELLINIRLFNPIYAAIRYPEPLSIQDLQKDILKEGESLLNYFISIDKTYVFIISKDCFKVVSLDVRKSDINSIVDKYLRAIKENNFNEIRRYGKNLGTKLFKPIVTLLKENKSIIIMPDGALAKIPFESLIITNNESPSTVYLLEKYRIKYVQSATLLSILRKYYTGDSNAKGFIGFGDPVYDYENFKQNKPEQGSMKILATESTEITEAEIKEIHHDRFARAGGIMDRLPQSGEEIQTIAHLFEKESLATKVYRREQAAEENARADNMKDFAYIHFSCHGLLNDDFQCLVLSQLPGAKEDGYFTLNEIMNCDYNAKLIVLSACRTGSGKMAKGEGITGLTRAFMYAGSPAVVASLWDVDDAATKELMVKFYSNMLEKNLDKVEALRQAKLELLKNEKYSSPLFWSAFVMYGE